MRRDDSCATRTSFVLVPGAWHRASCWDDVKRLLEGRGYRVLTPALSGMEGDTAAIGSVSRDTWVRLLADAVEQEAGPVILVGHSRGCLLISEAAQLVQSRISTLVYIAGIAPPPGMSMRKVFAMLTSHPGDRIVPTLTPDKLATTVDAAQARAIWYNRTPDDRARRAVATLSPEPNAILASELATVTAPPSAIPRVYVECLDDRSIPISIQRQAQALVTFERVFSLDTDHSPFYSDPEGLVEVLQQVAARTACVATPPV